MLAGGLRAWQTRKPTSSFDPSAVKSMLFVELTRLGDVVAMLPVMQSFHSLMPHAEISVAVDSSYGKLLEMVSAANDVLALEKTQSPGGFLSAVMQLSHRKFDLICSMSPSARNSLLTLSTPALHKIGYFDIHETVTPFLYPSRVEGIGVTLASEENYFMENIYERGAKICRAFGIPYNTSFSMKIPQTLEQRVLEMVSRHGYKKEHPLVVIAPFAGWNFREWSLSRYATFSREIAQPNGSESPWIVFVGTRQESFALYQLRQELSGVQRILFFDELSIDELAALLAHATVFVGSDSGPLHLASALGIPTVGLFGPASPALTAPQAYHTTALYHQVDCSPCKQRTCIQPGNPCMHLITVSEVVQTTRSALAKVSSIQKS